MRILGVKTKNRQGDETDFVTFRLADVNYISMDRIKKNSDLVPIYHTRHGSYAPLLTLRDVFISLKSNGFEYADRSNIINLKRLKSKEICETGMRLTFIDGMTIEVSLKSIHTK